MVFALNRLEVDNHVANDLSCLNSAGIRAGIICRSDQHGNRYLIDAGQIDEGSLTLTVLPIGRKFLETVGIGVLPPVRFRLDGHRLAPVAANIVTSFLAKLVADFCMITIPIWTIQVVDTNGREGEECFLPLALRSVLWADRAWRKRHKLVEVVD